MVRNHIMEVAEDEKRCFWVFELRSTAKIDFLPKKQRQDGGEGRIRHEGSIRPSLAAGGKIAKSNEIGLVLVHGANPAHSLEGIGFGETLHIGGRLKLALANPSGHPLRRDVLDVAFSLAQRCDLGLVDIEADCAESSPHECLD